MALRDQPYLPLYIQDIMTDEKLNECSPETHGIYIKGIMCLMHKSDEYGKLLLKQKYKQTESTSLNFGYQLTKHLPYSPEQIQKAIDELIRERVCFFDGDFLCQKRMIRDNAISEARSNAAKKGGGNPNFAKTKSQTNNEDENVNEDVIIISSLNVEFETFWNEYDKKVGDKTKLQKKWQSLTNKDRELIMEYIPAYKLSQPDKKFRKDPSTFLNNKSWNDELIFSNAGKQQQRSVSERTGELDGVASAVFRSKGM